MDDAHSDPQDVRDEREPFTAFYGVHEFDLTLRGSATRVTQVTARRTGGVSLTVECRSPDLEEARAAQWRVGRIQGQRCRIRMARARRHVRMSTARRQLVLQRESLRPHGVLALVVRLLRRYDMLTAADLVTVQRRWGIQTDIAPNLRACPPLFVEVHPHTWRLTPWVQMGVPFTVAGRDYVTEATRFWVERHHQPTPEEECVQEVRGRVAGLLQELHMPPYFVESAGGAFQRYTPHGLKRYRLDIDLLPEGRYYTLRSPDGDLTFSMDGRAFLMDSLHQVTVVTPWTTRRLREALSMGDDRGIVWHEAGRQFRNAVIAAGLSFRP